MPVFTTLQRLCPTGVIVWAPPSFTQRTVVPRATVNADGSKLPARTVIVFGAVVWAGAAAMLAFGIAVFDRDRVATRL